MLSWGHFSFHSRRSGSTLLAHPSVFGAIPVRIPLFYPAFPHEFYGACDMISCVRQTILYDGKPAISYAHELHKDQSIIKHHNVIKSPIRHLNRSHGTPKSSPHPRGAFVQSNHDSASARIRQQKLCENAKTFSQKKTVN